MAETMVVDGGEVWAGDSGGDGPPLVLLHPGVGDSRIWEPLLPALTPSYRVLRYDARGYTAPAPGAGPSGTAHRLDKTWMWLFSSEPGLGW
jgi:3-oxoadipate enol-lactonase